MMEDWNILRKTGLKSDLDDCNGCSCICVVALLLKFVVNYCSLFVIHNILYYNIIYIRGVGRGFGRLWVSVWRVKLCQATIECIPRWILKAAVRSYCEYCFEYLLKYESELFIPRANTITSLKWAAVGYCAYTLQYLYPPKFGCV